MWNFDAVACAAALEIGNPVYLFHAQHLLYGFLGFCFWKLISFPFGMIRALPALQIFTSLLSAAGLWGLYRLLQQQSRRPLLALIVTCSMAVAAVFWVWSLEPQVYALGFLGLAWATYFLFRPETSLKWEWVGAWHALAVLGHVVNVLWMIPALYWIWTDDRLHRANHIQRYLSVLAAGIGIPYLLVLGLFVFPRHDTPFILNWLKGSASLTLDRHWQWHGGGLRAPLDWAYTTLSFFWGTFWPYAGQGRGILIKTFTFLSALALMIILFSAWKSKERSIRNFALLWIAAFGLFWWTWEPATECYRMGEAVPFAILILLGLERWARQEIALGFGTVFAATLLWINWQTRIDPMSRTENNNLYQQTISLAKLTPENSLYLTEGGLPWIYLLYFTGRSGWNVHLLQPDQIAIRIRQHKAFLAIFIFSSALRDESVKTWLSTYKLKPVAPGLPWLQLQ